MTLSRTILLRMRNISYKICRESQNTHFMFNDFFYENRAVYELIWKNMVESERPLMTIRRVAFACWEGKAHTRTRKDMHAATHVCAHTRTQKYVLLFHGNMVS